MKFIIRTFFKALRTIIGPLLLAWEWLATRKQPVLAKEEQDCMDNLASNMVLYQFRTCPFCVKVRIHAHGLGIKLKTHDAQFDQETRQELLNNGGQIKVPCLRVQHSDGRMTWQYESEEIIAYLDELASEAEPIAA